ncbi:DUF6504 family protein [uncultured Serinicoccus sp.]|uniref:DUF6504 family protein n=1 Tax=uncultured Serinicoccus sp. TaxID=735514 RepID=UPI00260E5192|nr:DUF6504 family protein [uncultured Serinicoccus sp.]
MSRSYHEPVEVRLGRAREHGVRIETALPAGVADDLETPGEPDPQVPAVFLWRGRLHLVRAVLGQWSLRVAWWRAEDRDGPPAAGPGRPGPGGGPGEEQLERVVWRVEAGAGRSAGTGVYDLVQGERWWLERVAD